MLIHTREQWREALAGGNDQTPLLVELVTGGRAGRPWEVGAVIKGIGVCCLEGDNLWRSHYVPLAHPGEVNAEPLILHDILTEMGRRPLYVADAYEFTLQTVARFGMVFPVHTDRLTARQVLVADWGHTFEDSVPEIFPDVSALVWHEALTLRLAVLYDEIAMLNSDIETLGYAVPYNIELHARQVLARSTAHGYANIYAGRVHPTWHTIHESGASTITARGPSLTSVSHSERLRYPADEGFRWVQVEWPKTHLHVSILAARCGSPWLAKAAQDAAPLARLAELWGTSENAADAILLSLLSTGPDETAYTAKGGDIDNIRALAQVAPEWVQWGATLTEQAHINGSISSFLKRRVKVTEPRKACALDVQTTQAMLLKMLISRLYVGAAQQPDIYAGFHAVLPVHSKVAYQIDEHVPVAAHITVAKLTGQLFPSPATPLRAEVHMGQTWGGMTRVDNVGPVTAQAEQDLAQPGRLPVACTVCERIAPDAATLAQHMADEHAG